MHLAAGEPGIAPAVSATEVRQIAAERRPGTTEQLLEQAARLQNQQAQGEAIIALSSGLADFRAEFRELHRQNAALEIQSSAEIRELRAEVANLTSLLRDVNHLSVVLPEAARWTAQAAMPTARYLLAAATFHGRIFALGGRSGAGSGSLASVESYDGVAWHSEHDMRGPRQQFAAAVFRGRLFAIGGYDPANRTTGLTVESYDGSGTAWRAEPSMATERAKFGAAVFLDRLWAVGGARLGSAMASVEVFDGSSWQTAPAMPTARYGLVVATFAGRLYALGGNAETDAAEYDFFHGIFLATMESFDGSSWRSEADVPHVNFWAGGAVQAPPHGYPCSASAFEDRLFVVGGYNASGYTTTVDSYDGSAWRTEAPLPAKRRYLATSVFQGKLFAIGGDDDDRWSRRIGNVLNTVVAFEDRQAIAIFVDRGE